jgi:hypothetical protein
MREELKNGSCEGIALQQLTFGQKVLSVALACMSTGLLIVLPTIL